MIRRPFSRSSSLSSSSSEVEVLIVSTERLDERDDETDRGKFNNDTADDTSESPKKTALTGNYSTFGTGAKTKTAYGRKTANDDVRKPVRSFLRRRLHSSEQFERTEYISKRTMTKTQERMNAITVLPSFFFCAYYLLSGSWLRERLHDIVEESSLQNNSLGCLSIPLLPNLHVMPPLPIISIAIGIMLHAPFSFVYHWHYCTTLPPGLPRLEHWSRRMDQAFIHVISTTMSYGTSGRWDYCFANVLFNSHCIYHMFRPTATPRKAQIRILVSVIAYTIPVLRRGDTSTFLQMWAILAMSLWLFSAYPIKGWSHSAFHAVIALLPPICMNAALELHASQGQLIKAAACAALRENT